MKERKDYLVYLIENQTQVLNDLKFCPNVPYRTIPIKNKHLVYGTLFTKTEFKKHFEYVLDRVKKDFEMLGLIENGEPVSIEKFIALTYTHTYVLNNGTKFIIFIKKRSIDNMLMYGFFPEVLNSSEETAYQESYAHFIKFLQGDSGIFDKGLIQYSNCGQPIHYGNLRVK